MRVIQVSNYQEVCKEHKNSGIFVPICLIVSEKNIRLMEKVMICKFYCFVQL